MRILKIIGGSVAAMLIIIISQFVSQIIAGIFPYVWMSEIVQTLLYVGIALALGFVFTHCILKMKMSEIRVPSKFPAIKWFLIGILLPVFVSLFYLLAVDGELIKNTRVENEIYTIIYAVFITGISAGIVEEFIFRGLIMKIIEKYWCKTAAILLPALCFGVLHLFNIESWHLIDAMQLVLAGTMVGVMFGLIAYKSNSIWASAVVHGFWNSIIIGGILEIGSPQYGMRIDSIWQYYLKSQNILLTGGQYGIEASFPAIIGYMIVILLVLKSREIKYILKN